MFELLLLVSLGEDDAELDVLHVLLLAELDDLVDDAEPVLGLRRLRVMPRTENEAGATRRANPCPRTLK